MAPPRCPITKKVFNTFDHAIVLIVPGLPFKNEQRHIISEFLIRGLLQTEFSAVGVREILPHHSLNGICRDFL